MADKYVRTKKETHKSLNIFKAKHGFKSMDETITYLVKMNEPKPREAVICPNCSKLIEEGK